MGRKVMDARVRSVLVNGLVFPAPLQLHRPFPHLIGLAVLGSLKRKVGDLEAGREVELKC